MLIDSHVHIGQFNDRYFSAEEISNLMTSCGVEAYMVSSTSVCGGDVLRSLEDIKQIISIDKDKVIPCLWVIESMLDDLDVYLGQLDWRCVKIHPLVYPSQWKPESPELHYLADSCQRYGLPLLIHTGYDSVSSASRYRKEIASYPSVNFILAHGRPFKEAKEMLQTFPNTYIDTSFMEIEDIANLCSVGLGKRILWGSDAPIPLLYYENLTLDKYTTSRLNLLKSKVVSEDYNAITSRTAHNILSKLIQQPIAKTIL